MPTHKMYLSRGMGFNTLTRRPIGKGVGTVLLDGGIGGQSSYPGGIDEYLNTVNIKNVKGSGVGLDKLNAKLQNLNIKPPDRGCKKKPISFSI